MLTTTLTYRAGHALNSISAENQPLAMLALPHHEDAGRTLCSAATVCAALRCHDEVCSSGSGSPLYPLLNLMCLLLLFLYYFFLRSPPLWMRMKYELAGSVDCIYRHVIYVPRARRTESSIPVSVHVCVWCV